MVSFLVVTLKLLLAFFHCYIVTKLRLLLEFENSMIFYVHYSNFSDIIPLYFHWCDACTLLP